MVLVVRSLPANAGDTRNVSPIPGLGRSPRIGNGNTLQYSCLENSVGRGVGRATVHGATESDTTEHTHTEVVTARSPPASCASASMSEGSKVTQNDRFQKRLNSSLNRSSKIHLLRFLGHMVPQLCKVGLT